MPADWLEALKPLGTGWHKEFIETAPYLIAVFRIDLGLTQTSEGEKRFKNYYVQESVGIATGFLLAALHMSGLATLTHTPNPMGFLTHILDRPKNERPFGTAATHWSEFHPSRFPFWLRTALKETLSVFRARRG